MRLAKSRQLPHNSVGATCTTSPEQIEVTELDAHSRPAYNKRAWSLSAICHQQSHPKVCCKEFNCRLKYAWFMKTNRHNLRGREVPAEYSWTLQCQIHTDDATKLYSFVASLLMVQTGHKRRLHWLVNSRLNNDTDAWVEYVQVAGTSFTAKGTWVPLWITRCYLPPGRGDIPASTPAKLSRRYSILAELT